MMCKNFNCTVGYRAVLMMMLQNYVFMEKIPMYSDKEARLLFKNDLVIHILFQYHMQNGYIADDQREFITEVSLGEHKE